METHRWPLQGSVRIILGCILVPFASWQKMRDIRWKSDSGFPIENATATVIVFFLDATPAEVKFKYNKNAF